MNFFTVMGFIAAALVFSYGALTATDKPETFLNGHAVLIVFGGSLAAAAICFGLDHLWALMKIFFARMFKGKRTDYKKTIESLMQLADSYRTGKDKVRLQIREIEDPFLQEAVETLLDESIDNKTVVRLLRTRVNQMYLRYHDDALMFKTVGKFPPAFGLMGTTLGMIALLQKLGEPGAQSKIGPAMAIGLVATLYGIALANFLFIPISENLMQQAKEVRLKNIIIVEGVKLIAQGINPVLLADELNSFLLPKERVARKRGGGSQGFSNAA